MDWVARAGLPLLEGALDYTALGWVLAFVTVGFLAVIYIIASDGKRFLTRFDLPQWRESYYLRALPNFLQALHDHHFATPWPRERNAVAAGYFRFRVRPLLKAKSAGLRRAFLEQHIALFALLEILRPYLDDFVLSEQQKIVGARLLEMEDTLDRDRLMEFLEAVRSHRARFYGSMTDFDRHTLVQIIDRKWIPTLRRAHAIFQEHGYILMPQFSELRRWEEMSGVELVQELPALPVLRPKDLPSQQPAARG